MNDTPRPLNVYFLPQFVPEHELAGSTVVVVDLLRASTTIITALAAGAKDVVPYVEVSDTAQAAANYDRSEVLLGGERGGEKIAGFDLGNSPSEYTSEEVYGRRLLFTTTNGTQALQHARLAGRVVIGAAVNLSALVGSIQDAERIDILCAGTRGHVTREDILAAGAMVDRLTETNPTWQLNDSAERARGEWAELASAAGASDKSLSEQLAGELRSTQGGKNLLAIGHEFDLASCSEIDHYQIVPELDTAKWRVYVP